MVPLPALFPVVEVGDGTQTFDLHNDCLLREICIAFQPLEIAIRFRSSRGISNGPSAAERAISIEVLRLEQLTIVGDLAARDDTEVALGLDFIEYQELADSLGQLRFVFDNDSEVIAVGGSCRLRVVGHAEPGARSVGHHRPT